MTFSNIEESAFYFHHINYYRLGAYWLPFEVDHTNHKFESGTTFTKVINLYNFDRELRLLVLDAIERIEISLRTQWTYHMSKIHGTHSYLDSTLVSKLEMHQSNITDIKKEVSRSRETFICHARNKYEEELPAIWIASEVISLGLLSKLYTNLKPKSTRRAISTIYKLDEEVLGSWVHHLTILRNICAHHSRLWNKEFTTIPKLPRNKTKEVAETCVAGSRKIYNTLIIILYMMDIISPKHTWRYKLKSLLNDGEANLNFMGFPTNWKTYKIWHD